jgi:carbon starvation protein CstA
MITFITAVILLVLGYIFYGKFVESIFKPMSIELTQPTPMQMVMNSNKKSLIQVLNIAGVGPIFGPILELYGPVAFL